MSDADPQESMAGRGSHFSQLISLQTDLQDAMHVAKPVTSSEELLSLCNLICPGSTQTIPKVKVDWQKLRSAGELPVQGVLGEPELIRAFLESLQIQPQALTSLKSFGLYLGGGNSNIFLSFSPCFFGEMVQFDEHIFQMGGSTTN